MYGSSRQLSSGAIRWWNRQWATRLGTRARPGPLGRWEQTPTRPHHRHSHSQLHQTCRSGSTHQRCRPARSDRPRLSGLRRRTASPGLCSCCLGKKWSTVVWARPAQKGLASCGNGSSNNSQSKRGTPSPWANCAARPQLLASAFRLTRAARTWRRRTSHWRGIWRTNSN